MSASATQGTRGSIMKLSRIAVLAALGVLAGAEVQAQSAGTWLVKAGVNQIAPQVTSGDLSAPSLPQTQIDVGSASSLIVTAAYMLTDQWSVEFFAGLPYKHNISGAGAIAGVGKIGSVKQVSPTLLAQYRFMAPTASLRPYVGAGPTFARFFGEEGTGDLTALTNPGGPATHLSVANAWGASIQAGATFAISGKWFVDASVIKTWIKTTTTLSTGQTISAKLDPLATNLSLGYRF
jgi:outer membrane protein